MPGPRNNPRRKGKLAPIDLDELYSAPNLRGMCSFLERPPDEHNTTPSNILQYDPEYVRKIQDLEHITTGSDIDTTTPLAIDHNTTGGDINNTTPGDIKPDLSPAPNTGRMVTAGGRVLRLQRCVLAQDGHSTGEQAVYLALWNGGQGSNTERFAEMGLGMLSKLTRLDISNVRKNVRALVAKRSIEVAGPEDSATRKGRAYRVFSYKQILENRREAGLFWIVKSKGVTFVDPSKFGLKINADGDLDPSVENSPEHNTTGGKTPPDTPGVLPPVTPGVLPGVPPGDMLAPSLLLRKTFREYNLEKTSSSAFPTVVVSAVREVVREFDDDAIQTLWQRCSEIAPDCTAEEVLYCLRLKAAQLLQGGKSISNPVGLMLWAVPKCFEGESPLHLQYRSQQDAAKQEQQRVEAEWTQQVEQYRRLADDPTVSEEDRRWYRSLLDIVR